MILRKFFLPHAIPEIFNHGLCVTQCLHLPCTVHCRTTSHVVGSFAVGCHGYEMSVRAENSSVLPYGKQKNSHLSIEEGMQVRTCACYREVMAVIQSYGKCG